MKPIALAIALSTFSSVLAQLPADQPASWREHQRIIDLHQHINSRPEHLTRAIQIMDRAGIGIGVNLSGSTVTSKDGQPSEFERNRKLAEEMFPGRFAHYMNLDYAEWDSEDFGEKAAKQIEAGHRLGAAGLKEYKRLGLYLRDKNKNLLRVDDPKLDPVWRKCGELGLPVSIHVADPKAFWEPYDDHNERWIELKDHRNWWFGDPAQYPKREELLAALNRVIERHPKTTFVCVHFANNSEDLDWVERSLDKYPNMMADLAARIPEIGRHAPEKVRHLFTRHADRILFATDFQVYDRLILGSGGSGPGPSDADAQMFFAKHWRWLESNDRNFQHMTPIQGEWPISAIGLSSDMLRKIYFENAMQLLARTLPAPRIKAARVSDDVLTRDLFDQDLWETARPALMDRNSFKAEFAAKSLTSVRALYSSEFAYFRFDARYAQLTTFEPPQMDKERIGLWDKDVVEIFVGTDPAKPNIYYEFEVAPTGEKLDLVLDPALENLQKFAWESNFKAAVKIDDSSKIWTTIMKIPLAKIAAQAPVPGTIWRINFYRMDKAQRGGLAWNPTLTQTFHTPARFGFLEFLP